MNDSISQLVLPAGSGVMTRASENPVRPVKTAPTSQVSQERPLGEKQVPNERQVPNDDALEKLADSVEQLNVALQDAQRSVRFNVDDDSGRIVVKVIDLDTDKVIRQIPSEEMLALISQIGGNDGLIINEEV